MSKKVSVNFGLPSLLGSWYVGPRIEAAMLNSRTHLDLGHAACFISIVWANSCLGKMLSFAKQLAALGHAEKHLVTSVMRKVSAGCATASSLHLIHV